MDDSFYIDKIAHSFPGTDLSGIVRIEAPGEALKDMTKLPGIFIGRTFMNDFLKINDCLKRFHDLIEDDGYLIIKYRPQQPVSLKKIGSVINFIAKRILPKLPFFDRLYNPVFNRKNKSLSKAEAWGRLMYCGFDVMHDEGTGSAGYILCKRILAGDTTRKPSWYPVIKLRRVGYKGRFFSLYKVRTMYPYSEFIQQKVYELNSLSNTGKLQNDFRITEYGTFIRKFWIDELPQIINLIRHDIKLVGIRAMSEHYFSLYPESYRELYKKVRPGFLSPLYDDVSFEGIVETERKYLEQYLENPFKTDVRYFFMIISDILKGKRST